jgi:pyrroloquinoline quinone (PQQ) biosynthesis protein C
MTVSTDVLLKQIADMVQGRHQATHPISKLILEGALSRAQLREWIGQRSSIPLYNQRYHGNLYVHCPDHRWRARIAEVVYEEGTGRLFADGVSHHELYLRLGEAVGISREQMYEWPLCPEAVGFMTYFEKVCSGPFLEGVSAHMLAAEAMVPGYAGQVARALQKHYGLTPEQTMFQTVHDEADKDHSDIGRELLDEFAKTEDDQDRVRKAVRQCLEMMWLRDDGIQRRVLAVR